MNTIQLEQQHTSGVYGKRDLAIVRGEGALIWDDEGNEYIDCVAGIGVANVGHCHPAVSAAIAAQAQTLITCQEMFYNDKRAQLLEALVAVLPDGLDRIFLCNSGTEAIEGAIKFARLSTGRTNIVAAMRGFHGRTYGALSATHKKDYREPFLPLVPGFSHVPFENIEKMKTAVTDQTAAVILEVVQGEGGVRPGSSEYFKAVRQLCDETGALLIIDEVQTGFGRTGRWFASEHVGIVPDLLALGKAIAGGVPMGAIAIGPRVTELPTGVHGSTFGGNALACAAADSRDSRHSRAADLLPLPGTTDIEPASRRMTGWPRLSTNAILWVATTMVVPSRFSSSNRCIRRSAMRSSTLPVGSSASRSFGLAITARAMETRCC